MLKNIEQPYNFNVFFEVIVECKCLTTYKLCISFCCYYSLFKKKDSKHNNKMILVALNETISVHLALTSGAFHSHS